MPPDKHTITVWEQAAREADLTLALPCCVAMFFRRIPAGSFCMGSRGHSPDEEPIYRVVIPQEFFLGTFVVTQEQYRAVAARCQALNKNSGPSHFKGPRRPVEQVSWQDATAFCEWLTQYSGLPKDIAAARLPTEAEWEYACRAGSDTQYYNGDGKAALAEVAWHEGNAGAETHAVDERAESHPFGLHGMHGNVWEWCRDVFDANSYRKRLVEWDAEEWTIEHAGDDLDYLRHEDRQAGKNQTRVLRGGSWVSSATDCRSADRRRFSPDVRYWSRGFRVCLVRGPADHRGAPTQTESAEAQLGRQVSSALSSV